MTPSWASPGDRRRRGDPCGWQPNGSLLARETATFGSDGRWLVALPSGRSLREPRKAAVQTRPEAPYFHVVGVLDGEAVSATWQNGHLVADPELLDAANLLVAMGEEFTAEAMAPIRASLEDPLPAVLTMIRSVRRVTRAEFIFDAATDRVLKAAIGDLNSEPG